MSEVKNYLKRDWTIIPFMGLTLLGFAAVILDFAYLQNFSFQIYAIPGLILLIVGGLIRMKARLQLKKKAGFDSLVGTSKPNIKKKHCCGFLDGFKTEKINGTLHSIKIV